MSGNEIVPRRQENTVKNLLFRAPPPLDLVERIIKGCGLTGLNDIRWFSKDELTMATIEEWLPELESYYLPCKARRFFYGRGELNTDILITIFRHIIPFYDYKLNVQERTVNNQKKSLYQISPVDIFKHIGESSLSVEFT